MTHEKDCLGRDDRRPRVSVIIPTYNGERFLREALDSVFAQTLLPCEIIVVDDCSTDGSVALAQSLAPQSPLPLFVVRLAKNSGGPARPINVGIGQASGEFISVLDQDDVLAPDHLASKATLLAARSDIAVAAAWCGRYGDSGGESRQDESIRNAVLRGSHPQDGFHEVAGSHALKMIVRWGMVFVGYPAFVFRRGDWQKKGGVDESLRIASDLEMLGWLLMQGNCAVIPRIGYFRREHDANVCLRRAEVHLEAAGVRLGLLYQWPELRRDGKLIAAMRREFLQLAFWFQEGGCYRHAASIYWLARRLGRRRSETLRSLMKLHTTRLYRWITRRPPVPSRYTSPVSPPVKSAGAT